MLSQISKPINFRKARSNPRLSEKGAGRVEPDRKWFGNTRVLDQKELDKYRVELEESTQRQGAGYNVLIKGRKLPLNLLKDHQTTNKMKILEIESYNDTFGPKMQRKRPKLGSASLDEYMKNAEVSYERYNDVKDSDLHKNDIHDAKNRTLDKRIEAGQSKRIWEELYKVVDSSDVVI